MHVREMAFCLCNKQRKLENTLDCLIIAFRLLHIMEAALKLPGHAI